MLFAEIKILWLLNQAAGVGLEAAHSNSNLSHLSMNVDSRFFVAIKYAVQQKQTPLVTISIMVVFSVIFLFFTPP